MTKILIELQSGQVTGVFSDKEDVQYVIVDKDLIGSEDPMVQGVYELDGTYSELTAMYCHNNPVDQEIRDELKRLKF